MKSSLNQLANVNNIYQGSYRRVLFLCSAGLLRSATAAHIFSASPYHWNTRTAGVSSEYALNVASHALLHWADNIICMEPSHISQLGFLHSEEVLDKYRSKIYALNIPDIYPYRDARLIELLLEQVSALNL
jgi:predicted protein tyrosine phosphatase